MAVLDKGPMLRSFQRIIREAVASPTLEATLDVIVRRVTEALKVTACTLYLLDPLQQRYVLRAASGLSEAIINKASLGLNEGLIGLAGNLAEPINLEDGAAHPNFLSIPEIDVNDYCASLSVPIVHNRKVLGVLNVKRQEKNRFKEEEEAFLSTLLAQLAGAIARAGTISTQLVKNKLITEQVDAKFTGVSGASGIGIGEVVIMYPPADLDVVPDRFITNIEREVELFYQAITLVRKEIADIQTGLAEHLQSEHTALFDVYLQMLGDKALAGEIEARIRQGYWAQSALKHVVARHLTRFSGMQDEYLRERGNDVRQLGIHILASLEQKSQKQQSFPAQTILIAEDLTPAMLASVPKGQLAGMISISGSATSHVAILAKALGVPTLMGTVDLPYLDLEGTQIIIDGFQGNLYINPSTDLRVRYESILHSEQDFSEELQVACDLACETPDQYRIQLCANISMDADIERSLQHGAEAIGLYRTEILFMQKDRFPTEEEQRVLYHKHMAQLAPRDITMRTLDIGGDKPLAYFPIEEANPSLGWRGIRVTLDHPEILKAQVRAMLKAHEGLAGRLHIMLPMVASIEEVEEAKKLMQRCHQEVQEAGCEEPMPLIGAMIEVPAAAIQAEVFARALDFLAVGSNDLTQYVLAVDRDNPRVAALYQELHPAMLKILSEIVAAANRAATPVSVCGELAASPAGAVLLMAMGYKFLSVNANSLSAIRWVIRNMPMHKACSLLQEVMTMGSAAEIIAHMEAALVDAGLERILRPQNLMS